MTTLFIALDRLEFVLLAAPPVNDDDPKNTSIDNDISSIIDYSPAVKLKSSFTLSTIKRTSNPVLQEIYKTFRDLVEKTSQGKIKLHNIQID